MIRIALATMIDQRERTLSAVVGVAFATALALAQLGIHRGLGQNASLVVRHVGGDAWLVHRGTTHVDQSEPLPRGIEQRLRHHACVEVVRPVVVAFVPFRTRAGATDVTYLVGVDGAPSHPVPWLLPPGTSVHALEGELAIAIDPTDRWDVPRGPTLTLGGRHAHVALRTRPTRWVGLAPMSFASVRTARELAGLRPDQSTYFAIDLRSPACVPDVARMYARSETAEIVTTDWLADRTERELFDRSGVGAALVFVALLGLLVAAVMVSHALGATLRELRPELATLVAMGAAPSSVAGLVATQALVLAGSGVLMGTLGTYVAARMLEGSTVTLVLAGSDAIVAAVAVALACALATVRSVMKATRIDPYEVWR